MTSPSADVPVLIVAFNRPEKTRQVLDAVRDAAPTRLFVAVDGPRDDVPSDVERCARTRHLFDDVGWSCDVRTLFRDHNLGCKMGVSSAITWFLDEVGAGIILEDDCVPSPDFFPFCAELLDRYADVDKVMMIGGFNILGSWGREGDPSYAFSRTNPIWGWATWQRAWREFDASMSAWGDPEVRNDIRSSMSRAEYMTTARRFDQVRTGRLDSWGFAWSFAMLRAGGLSAIAARSLIQNIGFDSEATHTKNRLARPGSVPAQRMDFPLVHPTRIAAEDDYEQALLRCRLPRSRRVVTALPWPIQRPLRAGLQAATVVVSRAMAPLGRR